VGGSLRRCRPNGSRSGRGVAVWFSDRVVRLYEKANPIKSLIVSLVVGLSVGSVQADLVTYSFEAVVVESVVELPSLVVGTTISGEFTYNTNAPPRALEPIESSYGSAYDFAIVSGFTTIGGRTWNLGPSELEWVQPGPEDTAVITLYNDRPTNPFLDDLYTMRFSTSPGPTIDGKQLALTQIGVRDLTGTMFDESVLTSLPNTLPDSGSRQEIRPPFFFIDSNFPDVVYTPQIELRSLTLESSAVSIPTLALLFASALGLLAWIRRKSTH
jgi:hypothetical protein